MLSRGISRAAQLSRATELTRVVVRTHLRPVLRTTGASLVLPQRISVGGPVFAALRASSRAYSASSRAVETAFDGNREEGIVEVEEEEVKEDDGIEYDDQYDGEKAAKALTRFDELGSLGVHEALVESLTQTLKYEKMTQVQAMTIQPALDGKDVVAQAKTGTGKTLAFLVPVVQRVIKNNPDLAYPRRVRARANDISAIILSPTRELAEQIGEEARKLCEGTGVIVQTAVGGTRKGEMLARTQRQGCHVLVATPGRLFDVLTSSDLAAPQLDTLVLDEADRMLEAGFERELRDILRELPDRRKRPRQTMLFSATMPRNVISLARAYVDGSNFQFVQTVRADDTPTHHRVPQHVVSTRSYENLLPAILELVDREVQAGAQQQQQQSKQQDDQKETQEAGADGKKAKAPRRPFKAMVFLPTTTFVQVAALTFREVAQAGHRLPRMFQIHSKLTQRGRTIAATDFREARSAILFTSDVTARGMDFPNVTHVLQVGVPPNRDQYIHRLGRTGRAEKDGEGFLFVAEDEILDARNMLRSLPIQRDRSLNTAEYRIHPLSIEGKDMAGNETDVPRAVVDIGRAMKNLPPSLLEDMYLQFFGMQKGGRSVRALVNNLNNWVQNGWGWSKPPVISPSAARRRGLERIPGVRIGQRDFAEFPDDRQRTREPRGTQDSAFEDDQDNFGGGADPSYDGSISRGSRDGRRSGGYGGDRGGWDNHGSRGGRGGRDGRGGRGGRGGWGDRGGRGDRGDRGDRYGSRDDGNSRFDRRSRYVSDDFGA